MLKKINAAALFIFILYLSLNIAGSGENRKSPGRGIDFSRGDMEFVSESKLAEPPKTFEAWVKIPADGENRDGVIAGNCALDGSYGVSTINFGIKENGNPWLYRKDAYGKTDDYTAPVNVKTGSWIHVAIVVDGEAQKLICYINGNMADEFLSPVIGDIAALRPIKVGGDYLYGNPRCFPGEIADIRIWSKKLTQKEIRANMSRTLTGTEEGLMKNWLAGDRLTGLTVYREWLKPEFARGDYSIAIIPDIQIMTLLYPDVLDNMIDWIKDNAKKLNIKFAIEVGDLTEANSAAEWVRVRENFAKLDGEVPYAFVPGNHDYAGILPALRDTSEFNFYLPYSKYSKMPYFGGAYEEGKLDNAYYFFTAGDTDYMVLCLEMLPRASVVAWANRITKEHPGCSVIVTCHSYLNYTGERDGSDMYDTEGSSGSELWENFVSLHKNIIMVLSGHIHYDDIVMRSDKGIHKNIVHQFLTDVQEMDYYLGGVGMIALMTFSGEGNETAVNWYSTKKNALFRDCNQFSFKIRP